MSTKARIALPFFCAGFSCACDYASTEAATHGPGSTVPAEHRSEAVACPTGRGPGNATVEGSCTEDSECSEGMNGRCISPNVVGPLGRSGCSYDTCFSDTECSGNAPCNCRGSASSSYPNYCLGDSNCRVDADCGPGGFCSPSLFHVDSSIYSPALSGSGSGRFGYFCHTADDLCLNDSDCDASECLLEEGCGWLACGYSSEERWDCFKVGTH